MYVGFCGADGDVVPNVYADVGGLEYAFWELSTSCIFGGLFWFDPNESW